MADPRSRSAAGVAPGPGGFALVVVLVLLLALTSLSHGALVLARAEARGAQALERAVRGRLMARAVLARAFGEIVDDTLPRIAVGAEDTVVAFPGWMRRLERLSPELHLLTVETDGTVEAPGHGSALPGSLSGVTWTVDPVTRIGDVTAVVTLAGGVGSAERVESSSFFRPGPSDVPACAPFSAALDSLADLRPPPDPVGRLDLEDVAPGALDLAVRGALELGRLDLDTLRARLDPHPGGAVTPAAPPDVIGCSHGSESWGTPTDPLGPCGERRIALFVDGSLTLRGGEGQGFLAVTGDLVLRGGAVFAGVVAVGGDLDLRDGASLRGIVRAGGDVLVDQESSVTGAACPVLLALASATGLRRPLRLPGPLSPGP